MKSTIFRKILNEEFIEVNKSVPETIKCLHEQSGKCRISSKENLSVFFECKKNGKMYVDFNLGRYKDFSGLFKIYYVYANVISSNNKTYVKITSVYRRIDIWLRYFSILLLLILVPILIVLRDVFSEHPFPPAIIISIIPFIYSIIILNNSISVYKKKGLEFVELAKNEIKKRIQNTIQWEN